jgi:hypothetical protein
VLRFGNYRFRGLPGSLVPGLNEAMREQRRHPDVIDEIANALAAAPLSTALQRGLGDATQHAIDLEAAIDGASRALAPAPTEGNER